MSWYSHSMAPTKNCNTRTRGPDRVSKTEILPSLSLLPTLDAKIPLQSDRFLCIVACLISPQKSAYNSKLKLLIHAWPTTWLCAILYSYLGRLFLQASEILKNIARHCKCKARLLQNIKDTISLSPFSGYKYTYSFKSTKASLQIQN